MDAEQIVNRAWAIRVNLIRFAMSIMHNAADAEDAVSIMMLKAYQQAGKLRDAKKANAWLMQILARCCYDLMRKRKREMMVESPGEYGQQVLETSPNGLWEAVNALPEGQRQVMTLYYYEGFSANEIGRILGLPTGTVLMRLSRGRKKMKQALLPEGAVYNGQ